MGADLVAAVLVEQAEQFVVGARRRARRRGRAAEDEHRRRSKEKASTIAGLREENLALKQAPDWFVDGMQHGESATSLAAKARTVQCGSRE